MVFAHMTRNTQIFYEAIYGSVLFELLTTYTRKFIRILLKGEQYAGEYKNYKDALEMIQKQLLLVEKRSRIR